MVPLEAGKGCKQFSLEPPGLAPSPGFSPRGSYWTSDLSTVKRINVWSKPQSL